nr:D-alanine--D-alanine ligase [bacterium]
MNIVVLSGGISTERAVSLSSGAMVCRALREAGHRAVLVDSFMGMENPPVDPAAAFEQLADIGQAVIDAQEPDLDKIRASRPADGMGNIGPGVLEICRAADIVYMGLHGEDGENGRMQALFDVLGIRYTGTGYLGSALAMHKGLAKGVMAKAGIRVPGGITLKQGDGIARAEEMGFPLVVKPCSGGSSIGVSIVANVEELMRALEQGFTYEKEIVVEQYIRGREFSLGLLDGQPLPPIEIIPREGFYDYAHKYQKGWTQEICPAQLEAGKTRDMQEMAVQVWEALGLSVYARVDFILEETTGRLYCLEANTLPGMTPTSLLPQEAAAVGIGYNQLCQRIVALSMKKYGG